MHVRDAILALADAGALELDVLWTALLEEAAPRTEENPDEMELVEDAGDTPRPLPGDGRHGRHLEHCVPAQALDERSGLTDRLGREVDADETAPLLAATSSP